MNLVMEDNDFGMQLRNQGVDVLYLPEPKILHLKAPWVVLDQTN
jgi:GT2 family glycosyltransferase